MVAGRVCFRSFFLLFLAVYFNQGSGGVCVRRLFFFFLAEFVFFAWKSVERWGAFPNNASLLYIELSISGYTILYYRYTTHTCMYHVCARPLNGRLHHDVNARVAVGIDLRMESLNTTAVVVLKEGGVGYGHMLC